MIRMLLAAAAAFAVFAAQPVLACDDCKNCPMHKAAQADKGDKKDAKVGCPCAGEGKECKCGPSCQCPHCAAKKAAEKKDETKKS
ncbi:hypothetical protein [Anaeromyxobacter sp. PSR-1]|uniref:hypothetical protein n=1 Tax=unclassified Anaeromyxobacter TaxID=2620896 RepID=UPI0005E9E58C|nr:hypothetical protein [Anaeromyxobacter sp. PSR-1]GAO04614.1 hypothetical protein PSR1_03509 [Anaeromyxobacter sp. PSR-1]